MIRLLSFTILTLTAHANLREIDERVAAHKRAAERQKNKIINAMLTTITSSKWKCVIKSGCSVDRFKSLKNGIKKIHFYTLQNDSQLQDIFKQQANQIISAARLSHSEQHMLINEFNVRYANGT